MNSNASPSQSGPLIAPSGGLIVSILLYSFLLPFLVINFQYFPYTGLALAFSGFSLLSYLSTTKKTPQRTVLIGTSLVFSFFLILRANPLLVFFNFLILVFINSLIVVQSTNRLSFKYIPYMLRYILAPLFAFVLGVMSKNYFTFNVLKQIQNIDVEQKTTVFWLKVCLQIIGGILISVFLLLIIIPLLTSSNQIFASWVQSILSWFDFIAILEFIGSFWNWTIFFEMVFRIPASLLSILLIPRLLSIGFQSEDESAKMINDIESTVYNLWLQIPKSLVLITIIIFIVSQLTLYLADSSQLAKLGYSYGELVNEVFVQLSIVSFIVFLINWIDRSRKRVSLSLSVILVLASIFLLGIAVDSNLNYIHEWGFTFKRLWGLAVVGWIGGLFVFLLIKLFSRIRVEQTVFSMFMFTLGIFTIINAVNFDWVIYSTGGPREADRIPIEFYIQYSTDTGGLYEIRKELLRNNPAPTDLESIYLMMIDTKINGIEQKYSSPKFTSFNLSEYLQYQKRIEAESEN